MKITWREVFDTTHVWYKDISEGAAAAKQAGYPCFCWNGLIYETEPVRLLENETVKTINENKSIFDL